MKGNQSKQKILFISPSVAAGKEQEASRNDFVSLTGKPIGEGAFGDVWKVRHKVSGNVFAIKCVLKSKIIESKMQEQLNREIRIMYTLNHPHIIKLFNHFEDNDFCYLILEFAPNENLWKFLHKKKQLDELTAAQYIREVALAVEYLHNKDPPVIHRDIKPENILLDSNFSAKLCDFGWSNFFNEERTRKTYCGTLDYLAPEMIKKQGHNTSLDLWNLGVLLFELLTGKAPFQGKNQQELFEKISKVQINWPKGFPPQAKDLILKLLKINPEERISIQDLLNHRWIKSNNPIRETITNDISTREKLPDGNLIILGEGEIQMKENDYVVVSTPQSKLQYQNLKIQEQQNVAEEKKVNLQNQSENEQLKVPQQATETSQSNQQQTLIEAEILKYKRLIKELEDKIQNPEIQSFQKGNQFQQKLKEQIQQKGTDTLIIKSDIEDLKLRTKEAEQSYKRSETELIRDREEYETLGKLKMLIQSNLLHQSSSIKEEFELLRAHLNEKDQKSKIDEQQLAYCKDSLRKINSELNFDSNLIKVINNYELQLQKITEQCKKQGLNLQETEGQNASNRLTCLTDKQSQEEEIIMLQTRLKESQEKQEQYKEQIQIINKFWELDKNKVQDMKKEIATYENLVKNIHQNFK